MFREMIVREMSRRGWSAYRLGKQSGLSIRTTQQYVGGTCDLAGQRIELLCKALALELRPGRRGKRK